MTIIYFTPYTMQDDEKALDIIPLEFRKELLTFSTMPSNAMMQFRAQSCVNLIAEAVKHHKIRDKVSVLIDGDSFFMSTLEHHLHQANAEVLYPFSGSMVEFTDDSGMRGLIKSRKTLGILQAEVKEFDEPEEETSWFGGLFS